MNFLRRLFGVKKCANLDALVRYIRPGNLFALSRWIEWRIAYTKDEKKGDSWQTPDEAIGREKGDCEEKAVIAAAVIKKWSGWYADVIVICDASGVEGRNHAVCAWWDGLGERGIIDDGRLFRFPVSGGPDTKTIIEELWPKASSFFYTDFRGRPISERVIL